jgi:hypothetical protein
VEQPQGFERGKDVVWRLDRLLYGLEQAPRAWFRTLGSRSSFTSTISDRSMYVRGAQDDLIIVGVCQGPKSTNDRRRLVSPSFEVCIPTIGY